MSFDAYIFDLDGTLLDTLPDLTRLTNLVLESRGMPPRTQDEINSFVGSGARVLLQRATPPGTTEAEIDDIMTQWKQLYPTEGHRYTVAYEGVPHLLSQLKRRGALLGVLSNKFDAAVRDVISCHFPDTFDAVRGEGPDTPRKPDPTGLLAMMAELGARPERTAYVGDSGTDIETALAAGALPIGVSWGYRSVDTLRQAGARHVVTNPQHILDIA